MNRNPRFPKGNWGNMNPYMMPFPFQQGMMNWFPQPWQQKKPKKQPSEKALARIQRRTEKHKLKQAEKQKSATVTSEPMDIEPSTSHASLYKDASTQTNPVIVLDCVEDPRAKVIAEDKHLSKLAAFKKLKAKIQKQKNNHEHAKVHDNTSAVKNASETDEKKLSALSGKARAKESATSEAYEPQFTSKKAAEDFERMRLSNPYVPAKNNTEENLLESDNE